jgi:hypothetical protein
MIIHRFALLALALLYTPLLAKDQTVSRNWQQGTVVSIQPKHYGTLHPLSAEVDIEIATSANIVYRMIFRERIHKVDFVPGVDIVAGEIRRKKLHLDVTVGSLVRFAVSSRNGWLIDNQGIERKLIVKSESLIPTPKP